MTTQSGSLPERVARIEGVLEHLATKADLERLRADLRTEMQRLKFTLVSIQLTGLGIILAAMRLWM
ncbi:MAG: hypothetical protein F4X80_06365 [Chloroflexi bacterium]|nr:hypothetical protein [Chloroflexota bacterium]